MIRLKDKNERLEIDEMKMQEKKSEVDAHYIIKCVEVNDLTSKLAMYSHVDLDRYHNSSSELKIATNLKQEIEKDFHEQKHLATERLAALKAKDR